MTILFLKLKLGLCRLFIIRDNLKGKAIRSWPLIEKPLRLMMTAQLLFCLSSQFVWAATGASALIGNLVSIMLSIFKYVGMALIAWGVIQFLMAVKKADAESKSEAVTTAVVGIALLCLNTLVKALGIDELSSVSNDKLDGGGA